MNKTSLNIDMIACNLKGTNQSKNDSCYKSTDSCKKESNNSLDQIFCKYDFRLSKNSHNSMDMSIQTKLMKKIYAKIRIRKITRKKLQQIC